MVAGGGFLSYLNHQLIRKRDSDFKKNCNYEKREINTFENSSWKILCTVPWIQIEFAQLTWTDLASIIILVSYWLKTKSLLFFYRWELFFYHLPMREKLLYLLNLNFRYNYWRTVLIDRIKMFLKITLKDKAWIAIWKI